MRWSAEQQPTNQAVLDDLVDGGTYRDSRTGWVGTLQKPAGGAANLIQVPKFPDRPKVGLRGPSSKEDRADEIRLAFLADLELVAGPPTGFGG